MSSFSPGNPFVGEGLPDPGVTMDNRPISSVREPPTESAMPSRCPCIAGMQLDPECPRHGRDSEPAAKKRINVADKGKRAEQHLAKWWQSHGFPNAARHVKTGDRFTPDEGDLVLEHGDFRLVIEVKHHAGGLTDGQITEYGSKLIRQVRQAKGTMGILVERRDRVPDPGRWWVHMDPYVFARLCVGYPDFVAPLPSQWAALACRTDVNYFAQLLPGAGLAGPWKTPHYEE